jgi:dienelactone hydrolase
MWFVARVLVSMMLLLSCAPLISPRELMLRQRAALESGAVLDAVRLGRELVRRTPTNAAAHYDLACALTRAGELDAALISLRAAISHGFDAPGFLTRDPDLEPLRKRPEFAALTELLATVEREGAPLEGVRTVLRLELPTPLRLRLPLKGKPRLALWLHPFGARLNSDIEQLAPVLAQYGYALAVPTVLQSPGWSEETLHSLLDESVPALADLVDVEHPLLIGLSAGSHAALAVWARQPTRFAAVFAGACAPELHGASLPAAGAPVFIVEGERDAGARAWREALPRWQKERRRVELEVLPGYGHEFVFDAARLTRLLERLRAGNSPGGGE